MTDKIRTMAYSHGDVALLAINAIKILSGISTSQITESHSTVAVLLLRLLDKYALRLAKAAGKFHRKGKLRDNL